MDSSFSKKKNFICLLVPVKIWNIWRNLGKNVRSKNVRVKHVRLLCKNVRQSSERVAGRFCYPSFTPVLAIGIAKGWVERR